MLMKFCSMKVLVRFAIGSPQKVIRPFKIDTPYLPKVYKRAHELAKSAKKKKMDLLAEF